MTGENDPDSVWCLHTPHAILGCLLGESHELQLLDNQTLLSPERKAFGSVLRIRSKRWREEWQIPFSESQFIGLFQRLFNRLVPGLEGQPGPLRWLFISDVDVSPLVSPLHEESIDKSTTAISLGSPGYNVVSRWAEDGLGAIGRFCGADDRNSQSRSRVESN